MSALLIWIIYHKIKFVNRSYLVYTRIHLYYHYLYDVCDIDFVMHIVSISVHHSYPIFVPICAKVILSSHIHHSYWYIYDNISFIVHIPDNLIPVVI